MPSESIIDKSDILHSGLFSDINKHLSPFFIYLDISSESLMTFEYTSSQEYFFSTSFKDCKNTLVLSCVRYCL